MKLAVAGCLPAGFDSKGLLTQNWITKAAEAAEAAAAAAAASAPPSAFNPADPQYNELARRLSKSAAMQKLQELRAAVMRQEQQLQALTGHAKETMKAELEESQQQVTEAQAALTELQASFEQDPLSLTPWMNALFALADSGVTMFDTGGSVSSAHPPPGVPLLELMAPPCAAAGGPAGVSTWLYRGAERVLGAFRRRFELERGSGLLQVTTRLALSPFGGSTPAELTAAAEAALEASRQAVLGPEGAAAGGLLDTVMLHWLDYEDLQSFVSVLLGLKRFMAPAGTSTQQAQELAAAAVAEGGVGPKLAALGLVQPTAEALTAAVRAGVAISCISLPFNLLDTSSAPLVALCASQGITMLASAPTAHGLISEHWLGTAAPDAAAAAGGGGEGCDNLAAGLDMVARYGDWPRFQELLISLKAIADRHDTSLQVVALAWLQQQGCVPLLPAHWSNTGSGAPWPLSLGLQHYHLDLPPMGKGAATLGAECATAAAVGADQEAAAATAAATDGLGAAAAAAEGVEGGELGQKAGADDNKVSEGMGSAAVTPGKGGTAGATWMDQMGQMLGQEDWAQLAGLVGRPASSAAA